MLRVPFSQYLIPTNTFTELIVIKIFEKFDNKDFGLETIEFLLSNEQLQIKQASLKVRTTLFGIRWYMREWFIACLVIVVASMATIASTIVLVAVFMIKRTGWLTFI
jgi:hypothetical protein